ncbi:MAG: ribonuclease P protein component [Candidatus Theseobacter exili]|nr:ribonuclease P protein component [Candidatus Theseobacter exili]
MAKKIRKNGFFKHDVSLSVKYLPEKDYRYTPVISKRQGTSVARNRVKRVIRELMRCNEHLYPAGLFMVYFNRQCSQFNRKKVSLEIDEAIKYIAQQHTVK